MKPKLYSFRRCPYAIRARLMLALCAVEYDLIEVDLKNKPKEMLDLSPKGTVPVLLLPDKKVIDESYDIVLWALDQKMPHNWKVLSKHQILEGDALLVGLNETLIPALNRYKYASRYEDVDIDVEEKKIQGYLEKLEACNPQEGALLDNQSIYDVLIFPLIRQVNIANKDLIEQYSLLNNWLNYWVGHPKFTGVM